MTKRESILAAIKASLTGVTGVADASVYRSRTVPIARGETPAIIVEPVSDTPNETALGYLDWNLTARIVVIARGDVPDQEADPIIESVHSKVMADTELGGLSMDIEPSSVRFEILDGDQSVAIISLDYRVTYRTASSSLT